MYLRQPPWNRCAHECGRRVESTCERSVSGQGQKAGAHAERQRTPALSPKLRLSRLHPLPKDTLPATNSGRHVALPSIRASQRTPLASSLGDSERHQVALRDPTLLSAWTPAQPRVASAPEPSDRPGRALSLAGDSMLHTSSLSARHFDATPQSGPGFGLRQSEASAVGLENDHFVEGADLDPYDCMLLEEQQSSAQRSWCDRVDGLLRDLGGIPLTEEPGAPGEAPSLRAGLECQLQHVRAAPDIRAAASYLQPPLYDGARRAAGAAHPRLAQ